MGEVVYLKFARAVLVPDDLMTENAGLSWAIGIRLFLESNNFDKTKNVNFFIGKKEKGKLIPYDCDQSNVLDSYKSLMKDGFIENSLFATQTTL
jgi:hypothetical protein